MTTGNRTRKGQIQFKHGFARDVPKRMSVAEPGFSVDTLDLYIGMGSTNPPVNITGGLKEQIKAVQQQLEEFGTRKFQTDLIDTTTLEKVGSIFIDTEGIKFVDNDGNILIKIGSDFDSVFQSVTATDINWETLQLLRVTKEVPSTLYVTPNATGDGTGRNTSNKADSIEDIARYIKSFGCYLDKDVIVKIENGDYYNLDKPVFEGLIGNGKITLDFSKEVKGQYAIKACNNTVVLQIEGQRYNHLSDMGAVLDSPKGCNALLVADNATIKVKGIRSKKITDTTFIDTFALVENGGVIFVNNCDVAQYENQYYGNNMFTIHDQNNIGNCTRRLAGTSGVMYYGGYRINPKNSNELDSLSFVALHNYTSPNNSTGKDSLYVPSASGGGSEGGGETPSPNPNPPVTPPEEVRKTVSKVFDLTNLHTTVSGSGLFTSAKTKQMGQGHWVNSNGNAYQNHTGHGTIPTEVKTYVSDAIEGTVEISLTLHRVNSGHGYAGAVPVPKVKRPNGAYYNEGKGVARNSNITLNLPSDIVTAICDGSMTEVQTYSSSQNDYAFFDVASIKVTCTKIIQV
ncbi:MAG: hypothetical protein ACLTG7_01005 [Romboutsia sp.]